MPGKRLGRGLLACVISVTAMAAMLAPAPSASAAQASPEPAPAAQVAPTDADEISRLIVAYEPGVSASEAPGAATGDSSVPEAELSPDKSLGEGMRTVKLATPVSAAQAAQIASELTADPRVKWAQPDGRVRADSATSPNDAKYLNNSLWGLNGVYGIEMPTAWAITQGSSSVIVAVLDTGITAHPELDRQLVAGYDMIVDPLEANDGNGRDSDPSDMGDFVTDAEDDVGGAFEGCGTGNSSWHGTHVSGTIAAATDNVDGVASIAPNVRLQHVRVLGKCGGWSSDIIAAITWASGGTVSGVPANATPAAIINMSLGGSGACSTQPAYQKAINAAVARGTSIVVAAGNSDLDASQQTPASCSNVITVASTTISGKRSSFSNYGSEVEVSAPGSGVWSTLNTGSTVPVAPTYASYSGTSMATPHVAGVLALAKSVNASLTPAQLTALVAAPADVKAFAGTPASCDPLAAKTCGPGIINANRILKSAQGADLSGLQLSQASLAPAFNIDTMNYAATVPNSVATLTATPTLAPGLSGGSVQVKLGAGSFTTVGSGATSAPLALAVGANTITARVTLGGGVTSDYVALVTRQAAAAVITTEVAPSISVSAAPVTASGVSVQFVNAPTQLVTGRKTTFTTVLSPDRSAVPLGASVISGSVTVKANGNTVCAGAVSAGPATCRGAVNATGRVMLSASFSGTVGGAEITAESAATPSSAAGIAITSAARKAAGKKVRLTVTGGHALSKRTVTVWAKSGSKWVKLGTAKVNANKVWRFSAKIKKQKGQLVIRATEGKNITAPFLAANA